ncbi:hypothetical protein CPB83DRAFT_851476 [Crepidotus variabilis]|uniref:Uncharacterized protein n=1 Tax=Crepidotus variabilis TaxID=179855 RepID=A0A9P6EJI0_9AGAR|nr:hypothetical protein CPB83DRAFT_851476 [Crepidotus variabilis]
MTNIHCLKAFLAYICSISTLSIPFGFRLRILLFDSAENSMFCCTHALVEINKSNSITETFPRLSTMQ